MLAQEVEKSFPELVVTDKDGIKSVEYDKLGAIALNGIKEQQKIIEKQQDQINDLLKRVSYLESLQK